MVNLWDGDVYSLICETKPFIIHLLISSTTTLSGIVVRASTLSLEGQRFKPLAKSFKMVHVVSLFDTQHLEYRAWTTPIGCHPWGVGGISTSQLLLPLPLTKCGDVTAGTG